MVLEMIQAEEAEKLLLSEAKILKTNSKKTIRLKLTQIRCSHDIQAGGCQGLNLLRMPNESWETTLGSQI
jgi:hypothetical protein